MFNSSASTKFSLSGELIFSIFVKGAAIFVVLLAAGIAISLIWGSWESIISSGAGFLYSSKWNPVNEQFGALSSISGTLFTTLIAMAISAPMALLIAFFLVELAPPIIGTPVKYAIELLAAVPSIIYGMWGLFVFAPFMADHIQPVLGQYFGFLPFFKGPSMGIGILSAGIILAVMILPFITATLREVFAMVPGVVKEAAYGMGSTTVEVASKITLKYGFSGVLGALFLGLGRALGETMAVTFVIGNSHLLSMSLFNPGNTIASTLANEFTEASSPVYMSALIELGLILFIMTFIIQLLAQLWIGSVKRKAGRGV